ncbi:MAG TPA: hypothetical protein VK206_07640 [Anaerolineales bacterium]|nr:hypothetical protein [Anaerolineales bacterium]
MSSLMPFLVLDKTCDQALSWVNEQLSSASLRTVQTFDLQVARLAHPECTCPHHGEAECNCQMVVLLVYRKQEDPATLIIHGQENKSWISLAAPINRHNNRQLEIAIRHVLTPPLPDVPSSTEAKYEVRPTV